MSPKKFKSGLLVLSVRNKGLPILLHLISVAQSNLYHQILKFHLPTLGQLRYRRSQWPRQQFVVEVVAAFQSLMALTMSRTADLATAALTPAEGFVMVILLY